jgi:predicted transcriptional regulator
MNQPHQPEHPKKPTISRALKKEVLQYLADQGGEVKGTMIYIHFALEHHEEIPDILDEFIAEGLVQSQPDGHLLLTKKGERALVRLTD